MKKVQLILFGIGNVGSTFINQILEAKEIFKQQNLAVEIPVIVNSTTAFFKDEGVDQSWKANFKDFSLPYRLEDIVQFVQSKKWKNVVVIDATASKQLVANYTFLVENGFHIIAANKVANTLAYEEYAYFKEVLKENNTHFLYETNVGAGLPVIETLKSLYNSAEKITKIRGVFSGSLSYIFNTFSEEDKSFSKVLTLAKEKGFTEPDPRTDLSGTDVARKLLILARELQFSYNLEDVKVKSLVPFHLTATTSVTTFQEKITDLDEEFESLKAKLNENEVLRYIGEFDVEQEVLEVKLVSEQKQNPLGALQGADALFEIYTESYGNQPLVIQGAGAGAKVTARGLVSDVVKLAERI
ncbi:aspartate kinase [Mesonia aestuariivivens]|uniref:Homoserine dehydrogenase n=1 Tax=Mesonia aestuariivivens TaxID=2796128 RepID=A0ABS6W4A3_9FLAO|nr:aspartate kinase [Mesonia aestuariivivens]MBW2962670.1 aspartate kinase [Mesonia aestuariivivens]